jgi:hypothetical protein
LGCEVPGGGGLRCEDEFELDGVSGLAGRSGAGGV